MVHLHNLQVCIDCTVATTLVGGGDILLQQTAHGGDCDGTDTDGGSKEAISGHIPFINTATKGKETVGAQYGEDGSASEGDAGGCDGTTTEDESISLDIHQRAAQEDEHLGVIFQKEGHLLGNRKQN